MPSEPLDRFLPILGEDQVRRAAQVAGIAREQMAGRVWWNVNSTARGGVAEMLSSLLAYTRGSGIDGRWLVISGSSPFFQVTKRIHHALHGAPGDASPLDDAAHATYEETLHANAQELLALVQPGDVVLLHDPQTAGLAPPRQARCARGVALPRRRGCGQRRDGPGMGLPCRT